MKKRIIPILFILCCGAYFSLASFAFAADDAVKGEALFTDSKAFGGQKACSSCHPDGKGLEKVSAKKELRTPAGTAKTIEEAINSCIVKANKGKALEPKSEQMKNVAAYIKSLGKKLEKSKTKGKPKNKDEDEEDEPSLKPSKC
jgi:cytochrome c